MDDSAVRTYVSSSAETAWGFPIGEQLFSYFVGGDYVCMTSQGINYWRQGSLAITCAHDEPTLDRYNSLLVSRAAAARSGA
jgi:hypothetical protein